MKSGIIANRKKIQVSVGLLIFFAVLYFKINLLYIIALGVLTGVVFGKVFCRWMCPMGFIMELMLGNDPDAKQQQLYNYHKLGCPIAWVSGFLNRISLFRVKRDANKCIDCGKCDKVCYISTLNKDCSLYKESKKNSSLQYSCSKCLACVESCPTNSLKYKA